MSSIWNSFIIAFSMFSKIPMPRAQWTKENMKYMFCWLPFVGTVIGAVTVLIHWAGMKAGFDRAFLAVILVLIPVLITGGIHMDGFLDTADAMSSWQERARRLEILKDSNAGAFAVITAGVYFLIWYGSYSQIGENTTAIYTMAVGFMVSRCFAGLGVILLPKAKADGTVAEFSRKSRQDAVKYTLLLFLVLLLGIMIWIQPLYGGAAFVTAGLIYIYYCYMALKYFGGTTGDLSGCFICLCETGMLLVIAVLSNFVGVG